MQLAPTRCSRSKYSTNGKCAKEKKEILNFCLVEMLFFFFLMHDVWTNANAYVAMQMVPSYTHPFLLALLHCFPSHSHLRVREREKGFPTSLVPSTKVINAFLIYIETLPIFSAAWWYCFAWQYSICISRDHFFILFHWFSF